MFSSFRIQELADVEFCLWLSVLGKSCMLPLGIGREWEYGIYVAQLPGNLDLWSSRFWNCGIPDFMILTVCALGEPRAFGFDPVCKMGLKGVSVS